MPRFEPFPGIRYDLSRFRAAEVTAPPYDVIDPVEREALVARSPVNAVVIDLPTEADGPRRYEAAAETFARWRSDGTLVTDERPSFTVYRMGSTDDLGRPATTLGVMGALTLSRPSEPGDGGILPHEHTTPKARSDRLDLLRATAANLSPIWGLSLTDGLSDLLEVGGAPLAAWTDDDGVDHGVWRVDEPERVASIAQAVGGSPVVIADGHHRYETALAYRDERRAAGDSGDAEATLAFVVELVEDQLTVRPIHRLLHGVPGGTDVIDALARWFEPGATVTAAEEAVARMADEGALALVGRTGLATLLHPRAGAFDDVADLDSARLAAALADLPGVTVTYQHGVDAVARAVAGGQADAGVLLRPATVAQIAANAVDGQRMPAKTTFFAPKPKTGVVFRALG